MKEVDKVYIAGFFDGEGCANIYMQASKYKDKIFWQPRLQVTITNNNKFLLDEIVSLLGFAHTYSNSKQKCKAIRINIPEAVLKFIEIVEPYIKGKKKELAIMKEAAEVLINHRNTHYEPGYPFWTKKELDLFEKRYITSMKVLKNSARGRKRKYWRNGRKRT